MYNKPDSSNRWVISGSKRSFFWRSLCLSPLLFCREKLLLNDSYIYYANSWRITSSFVGFKNCITDFPSPKTKNFQSISIWKFNFSVGTMSIHHTDAIIFMGFVDKEGKMLPEHNQIALEAAREQPHFFVVVSTCQVKLSLNVNSSAGNVAQL